MVQFFLCDHIYIGLGLHLANHSQWVEILFEGVYSHLSNKRGSWNKRGGGAKSENQKTWRLEYCSQGPLACVLQTHAALCPINIVMNFWQARSSLLLDDSR